MAKVQVNKSDVIRDVLSKNPKAAISEIMTILKKQGIEVSANLVYKLRRQGKTRKKKVQRHQKVIASSSEPARNGSADPVTLIRETRALAHKCGGLQQLNSLVEALVE